VNLSVVDDDGWSLSPLIAASTPRQMQALAVVSYMVYDAVCCHLHVRGNSTTPCTTSSQRRRHRRQARHGGFQPAAPPPRGLQGAGCDLNLVRRRHSLRRHLREDGRWDLPHLSHRRTTRSAPHKVTARACMRITPSISKYRWYLIFLSTLIIYLIKKLKV
jgi:hypothetical protein